MFISSCTRNASFEGGKEYQDLIVYSCFIQLIIGFDLVIPLEGEVFVFIFLETR